MEDQQKRSLTNRLKTAAGHVRGVQRMVESDTYCIDIIKQVQAIQRALEKVNTMILADYLNGEAATVLRGENQTERERVINELLAVFRGGQYSEATLLTSSQIQERILQRLTWLDQVIEQVESSQEHLQEEEYAVAVMRQTRNAQSMLAAFQNRVLSDHLNGCVTTAIRSDQPDERERVVSELLQIFTM